MNAIANVQNYIICYKNSQRLLLINCPNLLHYNILVCELKAIYTQEQICKTNLEQSPGLLKFKGIREEICIVVYNCNVCRIF